MKTVFNPPATWYAIYNYSSPPSLKKVTYSRSANDID